MAERKKISQKLPLMLGIIGTMTAVGLVVALVVYLPLNGTINSLNAEIEEKNQAITLLNLQIESLNDQIVSLQSQNPDNVNVASLQNEIDTLQSQIQTLNNVLILNASSTLVETQTFEQDPFANITVWDNPDQPLLYAGYVTVQIESSSNQTYVQLYYSSYGVVYDNVVTLGNGTAVFPVLPAYVVIVVGNNETTADQVTGTITATYHY